MVGGGCARVRACVCFGFVEEDEGRGASGCALDASARHPVFNKRIYTTGSISTVSKYPASKKANVAQTTASPTQLSMLSVSTICCAFEPNFFSLRSEITRRVKDAS